MIRWICNVICPGGDQLGLCGLQYTSWRAPSTLNLAATIIVLVPKSPLMHGKRLLNLNSD